MAQCSITKCSDLIACLENAVQGTPGQKYIELGSELFDAAGQLAAALLLPALRIDQLDATTPLIQPRPPCVWIVGKAVLFPGGPSPREEYHVAISGQLAGVNVLLLADATPLSIANWTFAGSFPAFPDYHGFDGAQLNWLPSFYEGMVVSAPHFWIASSAWQKYPAGLSFDGFVDLTQRSLASLGPYFPGASKIPVRGPIVLRAGQYPLLNLAGELPGYSIRQLAELSLQFAVRDADGQTPAASLLDLVATTTLGVFPVIDLRAPLLRGNFTWVITGEPKHKKDYTLTAGLQALIDYVDKAALPLPSGLDAIGFYIDSVTVAISPGPTPTIDMIGFRLATDPARSWSAPILGLSIGELFVEWQVISPFHGPEIIGCVGGVLKLGSDADAPRLQIQVDVSGIDQPSATDVTITAGLDPAYPVHLSALLKQFTGIDISPVDFEITELLLQAETGPRTLQFTAALAGRWPLPVPLIEFQGANFFFLYTPNSFTGSVSVRVSVAAFDFLVSAAYAGKGQGWLFSGQLAAESQGRTLQDFVDAVTNKQYASLPGNLGAIALQRLAITFDTKTQAFSFDGALAWHFIFDDTFDVQLQAGLSLQSSSPDSGGQRKYAGSVNGALSVNALFISVVYRFDVAGNTAITFEIQYRGATLSCVYGRDSKGQRTLTVHLGGVNFGEILEYLVNLVDPSLGFKLSTPWDVLYQLSFDNLSLEINLTTKAVVASYAIQANLGIIDLESIALTYLSRAGQPTVKIALTGSFVERNYTREDPLGWDLLNDPPPTPAGQGEKLLDLRYLGFGQNITFRETKSFNRVIDVINALEKDFPPTGDSTNPLAALPNLKFSGDGCWLIGADFTLMSAVSLMGVFNDPTLYGLRVALAGPRVKSLAGLQFEILYKKVTDTIGVYHIDLTLPAGMRQMQFGAVSVTVPNIEIDIYTNGNFRLDFGFPTGGDFSQSFCLQAGPFIGYGGFYFAVLDGATSTQVPQITNGNFAPVIEFGVGLSIGLGRTIQEGPLSAGATITAEGIVEGVIAWFNPADRSAPSDIFYRIQGMVAVVGKVYGKVDFVIIKIAVSVTASASVTVVVEAYAPILVEVEVGVEVSASLEILFFTIHFSFHATFDFSFQIGHGSTPPWIVGGDASGRLLQLRSQDGRYRRRPPRPSEIYRLIQQRGGEQPRFQWAPRRVFASPVSVDLRLTPALTPAFFRNTTASLSSPPRADANEPPAVQVVMALFVPTSTPPEAQHAHEVRRVRMAAPEQAPFNLLAAGVLRWALGALQKSPDALVYRQGASDEVSIAELEAIGCFLQDRANRDAIFTYERVTGLLEQNFIFSISNPLGPTGAFYDPGSTVPRGATAAPVSAAIFPMIPEIVMTPEGRGPVSFWNYACTDEAYRKSLETYYSQLDLASPEGAADPFAQSSCPASPVNLPASGPICTRPLPAGCPSGSQSLSSLLFCDYFGLLTQQAVQAATNLLNRYPYEPTGKESLGDIARAFGGGTTLEYRVRTGDTPGSIAAAFGLPIAELRRVNSWLAAIPGRERLPEPATVVIELGPSVAKIAQANADYALQAGAQLSISPVKYQVRVKGTLGAIATAFYLPGAAELLASPDIWVNAQNPGLLRATAKLAVPAFDYTVIASDLVVPGEALPRIAANFYTRARLRPIDATLQAQIDWYASAIGSLNAGAPFSGTVTIPVAAIDGNGHISQSGTTQYNVVSGDSIPGVAAMFQLLQLSPGDSGFAAFSQQITTTPAPPLAAGTVVHLPACAFAIQAGDSFASIAALLQPAAKDDQGGLGPFVATLAAANEAGDILAPRAVVLLPAFMYPAKDDDTLGSLATQFDLTIEQLSASAADSAGIFPPFTEGAERMVVPDVASRDAGQLVGDLTRFGLFNSVAANISRFLLNGMRGSVPPTPGQAVGPVSLWGLYDLAGQQFPAPTGNAPYLIPFAKGTTAPWFGFASPIVGPGDSSLPGATGDVDQLLVTLTADFLGQNRPAPILDPLVVTGPTAMRLYDKVAPQFVIEKGIPWQPAATVPLPGPSGATGAGGPSLWMFPQTLLQTLAAGPTGATGRVYDFMAASPAGSGMGTVERTLARYSWATAIPLRITRALGENGAALPNTYQLSGADQDGRDLLLKTWSYLESFGSPGDRLFLLYRPSAAAENNQGLVSDVLAPAQTFLLKANLSTETHSNALAVRPGGAGDYFAPIDSPADFLKYAWEASITGTGGFHLSYSNLEDGEGLPAEVFGGEGGATLWAVLIRGQPTQPDRVIYPFNNCAVLAENLDHSATRLFARLKDPRPDDYRRVASTPPGVVGFGLARANPLGVTGQGPTGMTRRLHSLVGYQVVENGDFTVSHESLPLGPLAQVPDWLELPPPPNLNAYWAYQQAVPIAQFGRVNPCPSSPALPAAEKNPYRGITGPTGPGSRPLSRATLSLNYHDVYGNTTAATQPPGQIDVPVGYTDPIIAVGAWPGAALDYLFLPGANGSAVLDTSLSLQINRYIPSEANAYQQAMRTAGADAARYREIFYQVQQHDVAFALEANLGRPQIAPADLKAGMLAFVTKAKLFTDAAATLQAQTAATIQEETLSACAQRLAVTPALLLAANAEVAARALFPIYLKPHVVPAPSNTFNTLAALAQQAVGIVGQPPAKRFCPLVQARTGGGRAFVGGLRLVHRAEAQPARAPALDRPAAPPTRPIDVATDNAALPLTPGITLRLCAQPDEQHRASAPGATLAAIAAALVPDGTDNGRLASNVYAQVVDPANFGGALLETGIVPANWEAPGIFAPDVMVTIQGITRRPSAIDSFFTVFNSFAQLTNPALTHGEFAAAIAGIPGLTLPSYSFRYTDIIVPVPVAVEGAVAPAEPAFCLQSIPAAAADLATLATLNAQVPNFFALGSPLLLGYACEEPGEHDTPATLAQAAGLALEQWAGYNALTQLAGGVQLVIPNLVFLPAPASCWAGYGATAQDSLAGIAARFQVEASSLARVNRSLPGIFQPGAMVTAGPQALAADTLDSLDSLWVRFAAHQPAFTFDDFVQALELPVNLGIFRRAGAFVTPLPVLSVIQTDHGPVPPSLAQVATDFAVDAVGLLDANRSLQNFLCVSAVVSGPAADDKTTSVTVRAFDTVDTVIRQLQDQCKRPVSTQELADANKERDGLLTIGRPFLLPPMPVPLAAPFAAQIPPPSTSPEGQMLFPVRVSISVSRAAGLVHPDFTGAASEAVVRSSSRLVPRLDPGVNAELALREFATSFESAFAGVPLACALARRNTLEDPAGKGEIWAVNFGPAGIARFSVEASQPKFYALTPLSVETLSGTVSFPAYVSGAGLCGSIAKHFDGVDLDAWMRQFFQTVDRFLTPAYCVPAFRLGATASLRASHDPAPLVRPPATAGPVGLATVSLEGVLAGGMWSGAAGPSGCTGASAPNPPADFDRLVGAKQRIADALRERVAPILNLPGATAPYDQESACEALYQQMLVQLSAAYETTAVVQFPIDVSSPFPTPAFDADGPTPPRFSGQVEPALYRIPPPSGVVPVDPANSLAAVAGYYGVSAAYLAEVIFTTQGLLLAGALITGNKTSYVIQDHDTLKLVVQGLHAQVEPGSTAGWQAWSLFIRTIAPAPIFVPSASFPLSRAQREIYAGDTLASLADFFALDPGSVARTNQDMPGLVTPGPLSLDGGAPYNVGPEDTLLTIASGLATTIDDLAARLQNLTPSRLQAGKVLRMVDTLPDLSLSTAKVSLGRVGSITGTPPPLNFLLTVRQAAQRNKLLLNLNYAINEIEYAIQDVPGAGDYQASSWLTLVRPRHLSALGVATGIAQVQIPVPLRAYPPPAGLPAQSGVASHPAATAIPAAREWDYSFDVQTTKAAQDTDHIRVTFGEQPAQILADFTNALFPRLAAFIDAEPTLTADLARLLTMEPGTQDPRASAAVAALSRLADGIATALGAAASSLAATAGSATVFAYQMTTATADNNELKQLTLVPEPPGPTGATASVWPAILIKSVDGQTSGPDAGFEPLSSIVDGVYAYPSGSFMGDEPQTYRFRFGERDVICNASGRGAIAVSRNDRLVNQGPLGPTGPTGPLTTNEAFIYRTPFVQFINPLVPLVDNAEPISIAALSGGKPLPLAQHLLNLLQAASDVAPGGASPGQQVEVLCSYAFPLAGPEDDLVAQTPILLLPTCVLTTENVSTFAAQLAANLESWRSGAGVEPQVGLLIFELSILVATPSVASLRAARSPVAFPSAPFPLGATAHALKPILRLRNLRLPLSAIQWGATGPQSIFPTSSS